MNRVIIAAPGSHSGKTIVTCGILQALMNKQKEVISYKCGPDYIDPMFHQLVTGSPAYHLDSYFMNPQQLIEQFCKHDQNAENTSTYHVIEGVMGYYDGLAGTSLDASTYDIARITKTPVILLVNANGMSRSAIAVIKGMAEYQQDSMICGVIFNRVSAMQYTLLKKMLEEETNLQAVGYMPVFPTEMELKSRHLGLSMAAGTESVKNTIRQAAVQVEESVDLELLMKIAEELPGKLSGMTETIGISKRKVRIAVARDEAFSFYYEENMELLREMGAELRMFSPLHDSVLPEEIDGIWLSGGYPELYAQALSENVSMRESIRTALQNGVKCVAECGGFMYLQESLEDEQGTAWPMVGFLEGRAYRTEKLQWFGYLELICRQDCLLGKAGQRCRAHEFHYWNSTSIGSDCFSVKPITGRSRPCIYSTEQIFAGYPHLFLPGNPEMAERLIELCARAK